MCRILVQGHRGFLVVGYPKKVGTPKQVCSSAFWRVRVVAVTDFRADAPIVPVGNEFYALVAGNAAGRDGYLGLGVVHPAGTLGILAAAGPSVGVRNHMLSALAVHLVSFP